MKKKLALLLAMVLTLSALFCLAPAASVAAAEPTTAPSQEIAYFNVSIKTNVELLFAVPAEGYTVKDGVAPVQLLLWEEAPKTGAYNYIAASTALLDAKGKLEIKGKEYFIFTYNGLSAIEMSKVVYVRAMYTDADGFHTFGNVYDYSIAEYANAYLNSETSNQKDLVEAMMDYGHFAAAYKNITSYTAEETWDLKKVTVTAKVNGTELLTQVTQLAPEGTSLTLTAPHIDGYTFSSWGEGVTDGKITLNNDVELVANYTPEHTEFFKLDMSSATVGNYNGIGGNNGTIPGSYVIGAVWGASNAHDYNYGNLTVVEQNGVKCFKFAHNGAIQSNFGNSFMGTGMGDSVDFSFQIKVKAAADGSFPQTNINIYRLGWNNSTGTAVNSSPQNILVFDTNGDIILRDYNGNNVVLGKGDATKFQTVTVVCDVSEDKFIGYIDGVKCGETKMALNPAELYNSLAHGKNSNLKICMYGGYQSDDWKNYGFPAELVGEGKAFQFTVAAKGPYIVDKDTGLYRLLDTKNAADVKEYKDATRYDISYTKGEALQSAVKEYVEAHQYFYFTDVVIYKGDVMAK